MCKGPAYAPAYAECGFFKTGEEMRFGGGGTAVNDGGAALPWLVIREDDNGNRYRVGRFATQDEAQRTADRLDAHGSEQLYWVVNADQGSVDLA